MEGRSKPQNSNNFAAMSRGILWNGPRNLAKFTTENCGPWRSHSVTCHPTHALP